MLHELEIQGFRCFPALTAKPLGRVNLIVGKNNSGKTAFLDAVELLVSDGAAPPVFRSLERRKEYSRKTIEESPGKLINHFDFYPANLYYGHQLTEGREFVVRSREQGIFARYSAEDVPATPPINKLIFLTPNPNIAIRRLPEDRTVDWDLTTDGVFRIATANLDEHRSKTQTPVHFLPTERADISILSTLWDEVHMTDDEALVPAALKFLDPKVEKVGRRGEGENLHFVVRFKGDKEPRRLGSLGDGMRHILSLALHLVPSQGGYLLIDEIDLGLHHSVMAKMWRMVIESARRLNIQVFATTHSIDCIHALAAVHQQMNLTPDDVMLHRLVAGMDKTMSYTPDDLAAVAEFQGEVR